MRDSGSPAPVASNVAAVACTASSVGNPSTGTVSLDCEAPAGRHHRHPGVRLTRVRTVPVSVIVPEGQLSASFPITTNIAATPGPALHQRRPRATTVQATLTLRAIGT